MLAQISISTLIFSVLGLIILHSLYKFFLRPILGIIYYKSQGAIPIFHPQLLPFPQNFADADTRDDFFFMYKNLVRQNPTKRYIVENIGAFTQLILIDPEMIKEFLRKYDIYYKERDAMSLMGEIGEGSIFGAEDQAWKKRRKLISSAFNFEFLKHIVPVIIETTQDNFDLWVKNSELTNVDLHDKIGIITGEVTGRFFFGSRFKDQKVQGLPITVELHHLFNDILYEVFSIPVAVCGSRLVRANILPRHRKLNKRIVELRKTCNQMIREAESEGKTEKTLLGMLLDLRTSKNPEDRLTDEEIIGEFIGLFGAGSDTTSRLISSTIYLLWKNPRVYQKVKEEVEKNLGDMTNVNVETLNKMDYLTIVLKEALRLGGPAGTLFPRVAQKDDKLSGIKVKKGTWINIYNDMHYRWDKYFSKPMEFIPERWLDSPEFAKDGVKTEGYAYIPFSAGPRNCIGQHLAMIEARILVAMFIQKFEFNFDEKYKFVLVQRMSFQPKDPLLISMKEKKE